MNIGARIKQLRESRGLTLEQVGDYIGVKKTTIQRYETEEIDIKRTAAIKLAEILNTNPSYIMGWTDCQSPDGEMYSISEAELVRAYRKAPPEKQMIVDLTLKEYMSGQTPMPCVAKPPTKAV